MNQMKTRTVNQNPAGNDLFYCRYRSKPADLQKLIDNYLMRGWIITRRDPLTIYRGRAGYQLLNGCLVSV